jgi:5-methylcytosine-specific restriction endonuclease McrA
MSGPIPKPKKRKRPARRNFQEQADKLFAQAIKERDGACVSCGSTEFLQCAHIISRSYKSIRTDERNAVTLCRREHIYWTHRPLEWALWVEERYPGLLAELREKALSYRRIDWKSEVGRLKGDPETSKGET